MTASEIKRIAFLFIAIMGSVLAVAIFVPKEDIATATTGLITMMAIVGSILLKQDQIKAQKNSFAREEQFIASQNNINEAVEDEPFDYLSTQLSAYTSLLIAPITLNIEAHWTEELLSNLSVSFDHTHSDNIARTINNLLNPALNTVWDSHAQSYQSQQQGKKNIAEFLQHHPCPSLSVEKIMNSSNTIAWPICQAVAIAHAGWHEWQLDGRLLYSHGEKAIDLTQSFYQSWADYGAAILWALATQNLLTKQEQVACNIITLLNADEQNKMDIGEWLMPFHFQHIVLE